MNSPPPFLLTAPASPILLVFPRDSLWQNLAAATRQPRQLVGRSFTPCPPGSSLLGLSLVILLVFTKLFFVQTVWQFNVPAWVAGGFLPLQEDGILERHWMTHSYGKPIETSLWNSRIRELRHEGAETAKHFCATEATITSFPSLDFERSKGRELNWSALESSPFTRRGKFFKPMRNSVT